MTQQACSNPPKRTSFSWQQLEHQLSLMYERELFRSYCTANVMVIMTTRNGWGDRRQ